MVGVKHLIECHCILPQFKKRQTPVYHKFTVYSKFDDDTGNVIEKYEQCNNCGIVHKITDLCTSEIITGKDNLDIGLTIEDMSLQLDDKISNILNVNNCDKATWEQVIDILENEIWEERVVIKRDIINEKTHVKTLQFLSGGKVKIKSSVIEDEIVGDYRI
jgi:hypothetical protein